MKIYEIGTGYTPIPAQISAATEIVVEELTKAFISQNVPVEIVDIASNNRAENSLPIREVKVPKFFIGTDVQLGIMHKLKRVVYSVALAKTLKLILKESKERVVFHFHNQYNLFFFLKLSSQHERGKCHIAYTNHSGIWRKPWNEIEGTIRKRYFQEAECMRSADVVFLLNEQTKTNVTKQLGIPEEHLVLIGNGVNTDLYRPLTEEEKNAAKAKWGLPNCRVVLQVGSVNENKGQLRTVEYLLPLLKEKKDLCFAYVGGIVDEEYQQAVLNFAQMHDLTEQIRYLGMLSPGKELNEVYNIADATILPSLYESFGMVAIESMAAGVPVFVDKMGMIQFDNGTIPFDRCLICDTVSNFIYGDIEQVERIRDISRDFATQIYSWKRIAGDYYIAFQNIQS